MACARITDIATACQQDTVAAHFPALRPAYSPQPVSPSGAVWPGGLRHQDSVVPAARDVAAGTSRAASVSAPYFRRAVAADGNPAGVHVDAANLVSV